MIDIHSHVLIGVDDGPQTKEAAIELLNQAVDNGITDIIATPHHKTSHFSNPEETVKEKLEELHNIIQENHIQVKVHPGQEIRISGDIIEDLKSGNSVGMNNSQYVLVELPFNDLPRYTERLFFDIQMQGNIPVIAHPERCKPIVISPEKLYNFIEKGALSQVTASSVSGDLGANLKETSLEMIDSHLAHFVASDAHNVEARPFALKEAYDVISTELGEHVSKKLKKNALHLMNNQNISVEPPSIIDSHYSMKKKRRFFWIILNMVSI